MKGLCKMALAILVIAACGRDGAITEPVAPTMAPSTGGVLALGVDSTTGASIETNKDDYVPGEIVHVVGRGWAPGETVNLHMTENPDTHADVDTSVVADGAGGFSIHYYDVQVHDLGVTFTLTATGQTSHSVAVAVFTDGNISFLTSPASLVASITYSRFNSSNSCGGSPNSTGNSLAYSTNLGLQDTQSILFTIPVVAGYAYTSVTAGVLTITTPTPTSLCVRGLGGGAAGSFTLNYSVSNTAPTANAGGPYTGNEGAGISLSGSGSSDSDGSIASYSWTYSVVTADAGANCSIANANTVSPTITCNDDGSYSVKLTVTDDDGASSTEASAVLTVSNVAPTATFNAPTSVSAGSDIAVSLTSPDDVGTNDEAGATPFTYAFDCGDGAGYNSFSTTNNRSCPTTSPGSRTVKGKIQDKDGGEREYAASVAIDNVPPTAEAGGPYNGSEGSAISITGSGIDPDGGAVTYLWSVNAPVGTCSFVDDSDASTTVTCNDNGAWTLTLKVTDDETAFTTDVATLTVSNVAPTATFNAPSSVDEGSNISLSLTGPSDPSSADVTAGFTYEFDCGLGGGYVASATSTHSCPTTDNGSRTVKGKILDKDGGFTPYTATVTIDNVAPTATFNAPSPVNEGSNISLSLTGPTDPSSADVTAGFTYEFDCGLGAGYEASATSTRSCPTTDNGSRTVKGKILDKDGGFTPYMATVTIDNVAPTLNTVTGSVTPVPVGANTSVTLGFTDPANSNDTYTAWINWDDGNGYVNAGIVVPGGAVTRSFVTPGVYTVCAKVSDEDGGTSGEVCFAYIVVYDPSGGFVTGGGWINSPIGAYAADPSLTGKANFGFVSKYQQGKTVPQGNTEFQFHAGNLNFRSTVYEWLVVAGDRAQFKGDGTINGVGGYGFLLTAIDGSDDKFRIKIVNKATSAVVYDNQMGEIDDSPAATIIGGGSIVVHNKK